MGVYKIRCPVCNGSGVVESSFGTGRQSDACITPWKDCPACQGTGMQEIVYWEWMTNPGPSIPVDQWYCKGGWA